MKEFLKFLALAMKACFVFSATRKRKKEREK